MSIMTTFILPSYLTEFLASCNRIGNCGTEILTEVSKFLYKGRSPVIEFEDKHNSGVQF